MSTHPSPPAALAALSRLYAFGQSEQVAERHGRHLIDLGSETVGLESTDEGVFLCLSRDCPFDEIAPAYLAIYLHHLNQLSPDVPLRHLHGYLHPIVARLPVRLPQEVTEPEWAEALAKVRAQLDGALRLQRQAVDRFDEAQGSHRCGEWPAVEVTREQLAQLGELADCFPPPGRDDYGACREFDFVKLEADLVRLRVIDPAESWVEWLERDELHSGFFHSLLAGQLAPAQLVVTLKALFHGARYSPSLLVRAHQSDFLCAIFVRCRELAVANDKGASA
jgi:hypothetical protein